MFNFVDNNRMLYKKWNKGSRSAQWKFNGEIINETILQQS